jgi:tetratricopeptide (TPR) repeat protein
MLEEALECCTRALDISLSQGSVTGRGRGLYQIGLTLLAKGDAEAAIAKLMDALAALEETEPTMVGAVKNGLAMAYLAHGEYQAALGHAEAAVSEFENVGSYRLGNGRFTCAKVHWAMGDKEDALNWANLARQKYQDMGLAHRIAEVTELISIIASGTEGSQSTA